MTSPNTLVMSPTENQFMKEQESSDRERNERSA